MRVAIDANSVGRRSGGDETYTLGLARGLAQLGGDDRYDLYAMRRHPVLAELARRPNFRVIQMRPNAGWLRFPFLLPFVVPYHLIAGHVDVFHAQVFAPPRLPCPMVFCLPDVSFRLYPEHYPLALRLRLILFVPIGLRRAARVVTVSETSKLDITRFYQIPAGKIDVTYNGIDHNLYRPDVAEHSIQGLRERYHLPDRFILYVGNLHRRKNLDRLVRAYHWLRGRNAIEHKLVIVGRFRWQASAIARLVERLGLEEDVRFTGYVADDEVPLFYHAADLVVYPSIVEGFGLPPLEAMACGTPVVTSNCSVFPEIVGDAAALVDPYEPESIAGGIASVLGDAGLREVLVQRGLERASRYRWETTARQTLRSYELAISGATPPEIRVEVQQGASRTRAESTYNE